MIFPLVLAFLAPVFYALMNVLDKFMVSRKIRNIFSYVVLYGFVSFAFGFAVSIFLDWGILKPSHLIFPAIAGLLNLAASYLYFIILKQEDASTLIGFLYTYPLLVAVLSSVFLDEILPLPAYAGVLMIIAGAVLLSVHSSRLKFGAKAWMILLFIAMTAVYEFSIKLTTESLPTLNGLAVNLMMIGIFASFSLLVPSIRKGVPAEAKNLRLIVIIELSTFLAVMCLFGAMAGLPATVVSSIAAIQPIIVFFFEGFSERAGFVRRRDSGLWKKMLYISITVAGVVLLNTAIA